MTAIDPSALATLTPEQKRAYLAELLRKRASKPRLLPLSFAQQRLWFLDRLQPGTPLYNIPAAVRLPMPVQVPALERAVREVVRRHESLRTTFREVNGGARQVIAPEGSVDLATVDLRSLPESVRPAEAQRLASADAQRGFDLEKGPLLRVTLVRLADEDHLLLVAMHHIVSDGWSMGIFFRELTALYGAYSAGRESPLPEPAMQYGDFAVRQREWMENGELDRLLAWWRRALQGAPVVLELPTDHPRPPVQSFRGGLHAFELPPPVVQPLNALAQQEGATLFMTLFAAFALLLHRYTGADDLVVGTPIASRVRAELETVIGFFANTLALRSRIEGNPSFRQVLANVREMTLGAYAHQDLPFEKLVEELRLERSLSRNPLVQVMFTVQLAAGGEGAASPAELPSVATGTSKFDLSLWLGGDGQRMAAGFEYSTDLFEAQTVARMASHFATLLQAVAADPGAGIRALPVMPAAERRQVLYEWNATAAPYPGRGIHELLAEHASRTPEAPAVVMGAETLTYGELDARANRLAHHLRAHGVGPESRVALFLDRCIDAVIGIFGILKAGGAWVPVDPAYPTARLAYLLEDARPSVVLTHGRLAERLPAGDAAVIRLDDEAPRIAALPATPPAAPAGLDHLAYVIYTSGSTGAPKGVMVPHRGLANLAQAQLRALQLRPDDRVLQFVSLSFDISVWDLLLAVGAGAALVMGDRESLQPGDPLAALIRGQRVTVTTLLPSVYLALEPRDLATVRVAVSGAELCPAEIVTRVARGRTFVNGYGPTENTVAATLTGPWTDPGRRPPIGKPLQNVQLYVLDAWLHPVPTGVAGELYIGGDGLARGYLERPGLTAERFIPHPFSNLPGQRLYRTGDRVRLLPDGSVDFLGRVDEQVKVRGYRVEPGEIEAVLRECPGVRDAAVVVRGRSGSLAGWFVGDADPNAVRLFLRGRLPEYMVPSVLRPLDPLPLTPNGKIDRKALAERDAEPADAGFVAPRTEAEVQVAAIWKEVLGIPRVGLNDNFFELGGHSLTATQVISRVRGAFQVDVPLRTLFEAPEVAGMARRIEEAARARDQAAANPSGAAAEAAESAAAAASGERTAPLSFAQQRLWFLDRMQPGSPLYNVPAAIRLAMPLQIEALHRALDEIVRRHESLRTTFRMENGEPVQVVSDRGTMELGVVDLREQGERERAAEAQRIGASHALGGFDLSAGPLVRAALLRLGDADHLLLLTMHHIVSDAWSMRVFLRELAALYDAFSVGRPSPLPELPLQYADFAVRQRQALQGERLLGLLAYWREALEGAPALLPLPTDRPRPPTRSFRGAVVPFSVPETVAADLRSLAQQAAATLFMVTLAAYAVVLRRWARTDDLVVGTPIAGRNSADIEGLIGFFVNTLALRVRVPGAASFGQLLGQVRETTLGAYAHQDLPFEKLVEELQPERTLAHNPLFQVMFTFHSLRSTGAGTPGMTALGEPAGVVDAAGADPGSELGSGLAKFDLTLALAELKEGLGGALEYSTDLFDAPTVAAFVDDLQAVLAAVAEHRDLPLDELDERLDRLREERQRARERELRESRRSKLDSVRRRVSA